MESYGVISLHELKGNGVSHIFELAWISVRRRTLIQMSSKTCETPLPLISCKDLTPCDKKLIVHSN